MKPEFKKRQKVFRKSTGEKVTILEVKKDSGISKATGNPYVCYWYRTSDKELFPTFEGACVRNNRWQREGYCRFRKDKEVPKA